jgi:hypothetical protein
MLDYPLLNLFIANILSIILFIIFLLIFIYIFPFISILFSKPYMWIWGFILGSKRREKIELSIGETNKNNSEYLNNYIEKFLQPYIKYFEDKNKYLEKKLEKTKNELKSIRKKFDNWCKNDPNKMFLGNILDSLSSNFNKDVLKNFLLIMVVLIFLFIDAIIMKEIFLSTIGVKGSITDITIPLFKTKTIDTYLLYGFFITITTAFLPHILIPILKFREFFEKGKRSFYITFIIITADAILLLLLVFFPHREFSEIVIRIGWIIGVIGIYWFVGKIIGSNDEYSNILISLSIIFILALIIMLKPAFLIQIIIGKIIEGIIIIWFSSKTLRIERKLINEYYKSEMFVKGFRIGFKI